MDLVSTRPFKELRTRTTVPLANPGRIRQVSACNFQQTALCAMRDRFKLAAVWPTLRTVFYAQPECFKQHMVLLPATTVHNARKEPIKLVWGCHHLITAHIVSWESISLSLEQLQRKIALFATLELIKLELECFLLAIVHCAL